MNTIALEAEVADLRRRLAALEERVRLDANADAFLHSEHRVREGDYCLIDGFPTRISSISREGIGKWTYFNGHNVIEPFRVPPSDNVQRLYTVAEVAEVVAKVRAQCNAIEVRPGEATAASIDHPLAPTIDLREFSHEELRTVIEIHRSNCSRPSCPVLTTMEDHAQTREVSP